GKAAQTGLLVESASGADIVGRRIDQPAEHRVAGQVKDEVDPGLVAPFHDLRAAVMAVASDDDPGLWPMAADAANQPTQVTTDLGARGRLARAKQHRDRPARRRVVDMDRQEAALVVMGIEQRE